MSVPITRTLPYVLREALKEASTVGVLIGTVVSTPDNAHVRVSVQGATITIPKLATYINPTVGEPVYILTDPLLTVALGAVSASLPAPPPMTNADTLDGLDSTAFLRLAQPGARLWFGSHGMISSGPSGLTTINHTLGAVPAAVLATPVFPSQGTIIGAEAGAGAITLHWSVLNQSVSAWALAIV